MRLKKYFNKLNTRRLLNNNIGSNNNILKKSKKKAAQTLMSSDDFWVAESMLSNSNFKVYIGDRWIKITVSNSYSQLS